MKQWQCAVHTEAINYLKHAIKLVGSMTKSDDIAKKELDLLLDLGSIYLVVYVRPDQTIRQ